MTYGEQKLIIDEMKKLRELLIKYEGMVVMEFLPPKHDRELAVMAREIQEDIEKRVQKLSVSKVQYGEKGEGGTCLGGGA